MGKGRFDDVHVRCPYYIKSTDVTICCEGIAEGSVIENKFRDECGRPLKDKRDEHKHCYCDRHWQGCPISQILEEKYEDIL